MSVNGAAPSIEKRMTARLPKRSVSGPPAIVPIALIVRKPKSTYWLADMVMPYVSIIKNVR